MIDTYRRHSGANRAFRDGEKTPRTYPCFDSDSRSVDIFNVAGNVAVEDEDGGDERSLAAADGTMIDA
jgi:hypothetical protein